MAKKRGQSNKKKKQRRAWWWSIGAAGLAVLLAIAWNDSNKKNTSDAPSRTPSNENCLLFMAKSTFHDSGWGMFTLRPVEEGHQVFFGDSVIQITDPPQNMKEMEILMKDYVWSAAAGAGIAEGTVVYSAIPGIGFLANGHPTLTNVRQNQPLVDHFGVTRDASPGAGAFSHYHDKVWLATTDLRPGQEIIVSYGDTWTGRVSYEHKPTKLYRDPDELRETGLCLDNLGPRQSKLPDAGQGAFATRALPRDTMIAPVPLIPIPNRNSLLMHNDTAASPSFQLLLNYCLGHANSSLLFFPYSPMVPLINHDSSRANAKLQWSQSSLHTGREWLDWPLDKFTATQRTGLLMELVATRDIEPFEEIYIDYGKEWERAWKQHVAKWKPPPAADNYEYPHLVDEAYRHRLLFTEADGGKSFPPNIQPACFYHYGDRQYEASQSSTLQYRVTENTIKYKSQRPCRLLSREKEASGSFSYTAEMLNWSPSAPDPVPPGHVVTGIPRSAIVLTHKMYTSDQHLPHAFRHEIGIPDELFPKQWMDLT